LRTLLLDPKMISFIILILVIIGFKVYKRLTRVNHRYGFCSAKGDKKG